MAQFSVGDIVTKLYGKKPAEITYTSDSYYNCKYLHSKQSFYAYGSELKFYEGETDEMASDTKTLYSFTKEDGTVAYGTHIGTNSQNQYLIEEKGSGAIHVLNKNDLEEVVPYTFSASIGGKDTHYIGTPGTVKKGDVLLYTGSNTPQVAVVTGIDTKNKSARSKFKGAKIVTEAI